MRAKRLAVYRRRLARWLFAVLDRTGHVWVENALTLIAFAGRLLGASTYLLAEIGSARIGNVAARWARQFFRTFFRGIVLVSVLGLAAAIGIGTVCRLAGTFFRPLIESVILVILVRDAAPLVLAVALAARMGASITAKLGVYPATIRAPTAYFDGRRMSELVVPQLVAGLGTAPLLFLVLAWFVLAGYQTAGTVADLARGAPTFFHPALWPPLVQGTLRSVAFGGVVAFVSSALGVRVAERRSTRARQELELTDAVWESSLISILLCAAWTAIALKRVTQ